MTAIVSLITVALGTLMSSRLFVFGVPGASLRLVNVVVSLLGLIFVIAWLISLRRPSIMQTPEHKNNRHREISSELYHAWPLLLFVAINVGYIINAGVMRYASNQNLWVSLLRTTNLLMFCLPLLAGYIIGRANHRIDSEKLTYFIATLMGISFLFALGDYLHSAGYSNFIGGFISMWNEAMRGAGGHIWIFTEGGPLRASGLEVFPFRLALPAVIAAAWACSAKGTPVARGLIHVFVIGIMLTSGSRSAILAYIAVISIAFSIKLMHLLIDRLGLTKAGGALALLAGVAIVTGVLATGYAFVPAKQAHMDTNSTYQRVINNVSFFKYELAHNQLDAHDLDMLGSGRVLRWERSIDLIKRHPLGAGRPYRELAAGSHSHNDILAALVWGGPFMLIALLLLYWWMAFRTRTPGAPYFGLYLAVGIAVAGLTESAIIGTPYLLLGLFLLGASRRDIDRSHSPHFSWDTIR